MTHHARLLTLICIVTFAIPSLAQSPTGIITSTRSTPNWSSAGISGGIPSNAWTQCGSTINPGATAATILSALQSCAANHYVQLAAGTFNISTIHCTSCNNVELRGMGADQTHIVMTSESSCQGGNGSCAIGFEGSDNTCPGCGAPASVTWSAGYAQGNNVITLSNLSSVHANSTNIFLDQCDTGYSGSPCSGTSTDNGNYFNCEDAFTAPSGPGCSFNNGNGNAARPHRFQWEIHQASSCSPACGTNSSGTVTLTTPLEHPNWASGNTPQAWFVQPAVNVGVRDLSVDGASVTSGPGAGVSLYNCLNCWALGVKVSNTLSIGIYLVQCSHCQVESNYVYNAGQGSVGNDPSGINYQGSDNLIWNNIVQRTHVAIIGNGPDNGNVVAYNYLINAYGGDGQNNSFIFGALWDGHSNGVDYNLFEGNVANQVFQDQTHGTHLMETFYRNFLTGWETCGGGGNCGTSTAMVNDVNAAFPLSFNRYGNWIGNIMGTPGINNAGYQSTTNEYVSSGTTGVVWILGSGNQTSPPSSIGGPIPGDTVVPATIMRWANWDANTNATRFCGNSSDTGWSTTCASTSEIPTAIAVFPNTVPTLGDTGIGQNPMPASFFLSSRPSWWANTIPFPAIGPDVSSGNVGKCNGTLNVSGQFAGLPALTNAQCTGTSISSSWAGHVNAIPAMACYLNVMNGPPDGSTATLTFSRTACYSGTTIPVTPTPATNMLVKLSKELTHDHRRNPLDSHPVDLSGLDSLLSARNSRPQPTTYQ